MYVSVAGEQDTDFKITKISDSQYEITQLPDGQPTKINVSDIDIEYSSLLRFKQDGQQKIL